MVNDNINANSENTCKICGNVTNNKFYFVKEMQYGFNEKFKYLECANCFCLQLIDMPSDMSRFYPSDYYSFKEESKKSLLQKYIKKKRNKYAVFRKDIIGWLFYNFFSTNINSLSYTNIHFECRVLDVGCGSGYLLQNLKELGINQLTGVDPFIADTIKKDGYIVYKKNIHDINAVFDLIMFHHSYEHIFDPVQTLRKCNQLLSANGNVLIRIPTTSSWAWNHYKENWVNLDAPRHIFLHSIKSINLLAEKTNFVVKKILYDSTAIQFWGSEQYSKGITMNSPRSFSRNKKYSLFTNNDISFFKKRASDFNKLSKGDTIAIILEKK